MTYLYHHSTIVRGEAVPQDTFYEEPDDLEMYEELK
jgi:hypothetical protein